MMREINNLEYIQDILEFNAGDFYVVQILLRNKDSTIPSKSTQIKQYIFDNLKTLSLIMDKEIIPICKALKARAYISLNRRNYNNVAKNFMVKATELLRDGNDTKRLFSLYNSVSNTSKVVGTKWWIIDIDDIDSDKADLIEDWLYSQNYDYFEISTPNGFHIITNPFPLNKFNTEVTSLTKEDLKPLTLLYYYGD